MSVEVEIKKSRSDLLAEFRNKKAKHYVYANADTGPGAWVPNYFYFYVPAALADDAKEIVTEQCPKAGIAVQTDTNYRDGKNTTIVKKPTRLRADPPRPGFIQTAIFRMSSQLCGQMVVEDELRHRLTDTLQWASKQALDAALRAAGTLDPEDREGDLRLRAAELAFCIEDIKDFGNLPEDQQQKWLKAAQRWLMAGYVNDEDWKNATYRL